ncbi:hypothetical protein VMCG_05337 [Cytospora schulzeri]|uniref:Uncharacterized protein n=1 Tax=Cytospora schulzeri TaxID=448051 RepID=A0A423WKA9_9PEZI|nr:hypothetical protein VMCG_05337 [Valsa malicola]
MQAQQMASHSFDVDDATTAGTVGLHQEERMALKTSSEVFGNTTQGNSSMFNDVHRGSVFFNVHLNTQDPNRHARTAGSHSVSSPVGSQVVAAWKRQSENMLNDIRKIVDGIRYKHKRISRMFGSMAGPVPALEDFRAQKVLFEVTVENGQLFRRIQETFRKQQVLVTQSTYYYSSNPIEESSVVKEVHDRLGDIMENLTNVEQHFGLDDPAVRRVVPKRQKNGTDELAARLKYSEACEHWLHYPEEQEIPQVAGDGGQIQKLRALVQEKLSRRVRVRLARIIAESVLKFNATDWLRNDLDGENVLVYNINKNYEPHLRVQITKPGSSGPQNPGGDSRLGQTFLKLAGILSDIALGTSGRQGNDSNERLYRKVKKGLNMAYADVVRDCENMAHINGPNPKSNEAIMTEFYNKVVKSLRKLEKSFEVS